MVIPYCIVEGDCMTQFGCARSDIHHVPYLLEACALHPVPAYTTVVSLHNRQQHALHWKQQCLFELDIIFIGDSATHHCRFAMQKFIETLEWHVLTHFPYSLDLPHEITFCLLL
jgi:hypothetical protein